MAPGSSPAARVAPRLGRAGARTGGPTRWGPGERQTAPAAPRPRRASRPFVRSAGITSVLTKSLGSANPHNVVRATFTGLSELKDPVTVARLRGKDLDEMAAAGGTRR